MATAEWKKPDRLRNNATYQEIAKILQTLGVITLAEIRALCEKPGASKSGSIIEMLKSGEFSHAFGIQVFKAVMRSRWVVFIHPPAVGYKERLKTLKTEIALADEAYKAAHRRQARD